MKQTGVVDFDMSAVFVTLFFPNSLLSAPLCCYIHFKIINTFSNFSYIRSRRHKQNLINMECLFIAAAFCTYHFSGTVTFIYKLCYVPNEPVLFEIKKSHFHDIYMLSWFKTKFKGLFQISSQEKSLKFDSECIRKGQVRLYFDIYIIFMPQSLIEWRQVELSQNEPNLFDSKLPEYRSLIEIRFIWIIFIRRLKEKHNHDLPYPKSPVSVLFSETLNWKIIISLTLNSVLFSFLFFIDIFFFA